MKSFICLLSIFLTQNCNDNSVEIVSQEKLPVPIDYVYFQKWIGGQEQTGSGINFQIKFKKKLPAKWTLKKVYFQKQEADFEKQDPTTYIAQFYQKPNQDLNLDNNINNEYGNKAPEIPKNKWALLDNEAVIAFTQGKKTRCFTIKKIKEKELIAYPAVKPRD
jgi:hypothetical protein